MSDAAFRRIVDRTWERMRADDPMVTRGYVEAMLRLVRQMGAARRKREGGRAAEGRGGCVRGGTE